jgi:hypothetical protein
MVLLDLRSIARPCAYSKYREKHEPHQKKLRVRPPSLGFGGGEE